MQLMLIRSAMLELGTSVHAVDGICQQPDELMASLVMDSVQNTHTLQKMRSTAAALSGLAMRLHSRMSFMKR